jgi:hypothetical protein
VLLVVLAIAGGFALVHRLVRALLRLGLAAAQRSAMSGYAELSARRGDLTALEERRDVLHRVNALRRRQLLASGAWVFLLVLPLVLGHALYAYAAASALWLLPRRPLLRVPGPPPPPG